MPVTTIKKNKLLRLLNVEISDKDLIELLANVKVEAEFLDEETIQIEVTPDRLDLLISEGIVRELKGILGMERGKPKYKIEKTSVKLVVEESIKAIRPYIAVAIVKGYHVDKESLEELLQFQEKLNMAMGRDRRKIAIGFYDLDKLNSNTIVYKAESPEKIKYVPLGESKPLTANEILKLTDKGRKYRHIIEAYEKYPYLLTDKGQVLSMPPILNSEDTKIEIGTRNIFIDITGTEWYAVSKTLDVIATSLAEKAESIGLVKVVDVNETFYTPELKETSLTVSLDYIKKNLGLPGLTLEKIVKLLKSLRHDVEAVNSNLLKILSPPYRYDILHPIDIVEDVAIALGYDNLMPEVPKTFTIGKELVKTRYMRKIREIMVGFGFQEILTFTLTSSMQLRELLGFSSKQHIKILNPISPLYDTIRPSIIPNVLNFLKQNQHVDHPIKIFELGETVEVNYGRIILKTKLASAILSYRISFEDIQAILFYLGKTLNLNLELVEYKNPPELFIKGRTAKILEENEERGIIGELHPQYLLEKLEIEYPVVLFELDITNLWRKS